MTQKAMKRLQFYYARATRKVKELKTPEAMSDAVWASFLHCVSTDEKPQHEKCPKGKKSWCFYNRALFHHRPIPSHASRISTPLCKKVEMKLLPIYKLLADPVLMK